MKKTQLSRREILLFSGRAITITTISAVVNSLLPNSTEAIDWKSFWNKNKNKGVATVISIKGLAFSEREQIRKTSIVESGKEIIVYKRGELILRLPDGSLLKVRGYTRMTLDLDSLSGGWIDLAVGAVLGVIKPKRKLPYLVRSQSAVIGIKGTVFYREVFDKEQPLDSKIPQTASDYFCVCNGALDILEKQKGDILKSEAAEHHRAFFIIPKEKHVTFESAGFLLNHSDREIHQVIQKMEGEKYRTDWLELSNEESKYQ